MVSSPTKMIPSRGLLLFRGTPIIVIFLSWVVAVLSMRLDRIAALRQETVDMFYHGYDNYMRLAFPEDELRPVSCIPRTRDMPGAPNSGHNDVLGNYSLTLIDSLSTLAILASAPEDDRSTGPKALADFQDGIASLVQLYGDGRPGRSGEGSRARGFDLDSKVQVFETVIRGVGGLLSAHLFAVGELPITGYSPPKSDASVVYPIKWPNGFKYDDQLLRLALDLAQRLLPAFYSHTGLPYPRVNLRHGIPFYHKSPLFEDLDLDPEAYAPQGPQEVTETCSAGAGSLVLEFTVLSRLTGDTRFEQAAKRAFWAVWLRKSDIDLIGNGVDAERGQWIDGQAGIGAGVDSFFEYALKTHILLSGHRMPNMTAPHPQSYGDTWLDPNMIFNPLNHKYNSPDTFLDAWHDSHAAIKRHLYSETHHPHYINAHIHTGSPRSYWIDSLGAFYPGLLALAGELDEAIETHLLYTALWTRYAALPERWSVRDGHVEGGLGWWPGRPEFIESTYHIYRATKDHWYLYVGEMVLRDITRRCKTSCGWSGLQDVRTGELDDRMESFFLGETAKYLYLLFDPKHPLNNLDASFVFSTEGHPLILPHNPGSYRKAASPRDRQVPVHRDEKFRNMCPLPPKLPPLSLSATAARTDMYHASSLIRLHHIANDRLEPNSDEDDVDDSEEDFEREIQPQTNHTHFPWTLPPSLLPTDGFCAALRQPQTLTVEFPTTSQPQSVGSAFNFIFSGQSLTRNSDGVIINNLSGLRLSMVMEEPPDHFEQTWRIQSVGTLLMGRDEKVYISRKLIASIRDPLFSTIRDPWIVDLVLQMESPPEVPELNTSTTMDPGNALAKSPSAKSTSAMSDSELDSEVTMDASNLVATKSLLGSLLHQIASALKEPTSTADVQDSADKQASSPKKHRQQLQRPKKEYEYLIIPAITPTGLGAAPIPDVDEAPDPDFVEDISDIPELSWSKLYFAGESCTGRLPDAAVKAHNVIAIRRGGCSFNEKLATIPSFAPSRDALQLVIIISDSSREDMNPGSSSYSHFTDYEDGYEAMLYGSNLVRPLLDEIQKTPSGIPRIHPVSMVMLDGGDIAYEKLRRTKNLGLRRRYHVESQGLSIHNLVVS